MKVYNVRYKGWILGRGYGPVLCKLDPKLVSHFHQYQDSDKRRLAAIKIFSNAFDMEPDGLPTYFNPSQLEIRPIIPVDYHKKMVRKLQRSKTVISSAA